ncbi:flagellar hook-basal body complex protein FliE [Dyella sp. S184]|uniref:flagellar hook-basal body complex protein FliE n=1 Tax=Dyella sp. S184 TaxID=1641862 RepID=UPI001C205E50|nr:flagellar hook-basal body complex protein FliE [Dyella sp. S184]
MSITPIAPLSIGQIGLPEGGIADVAQSGPQFMQMVGSAVDGLNGSLNDADASARSLAAGGNVPVHDVMIAMEHAHLQLQFAVEVRNRLLSAYENLTNMQV